MEPLTGKKTEKIEKTVEKRKEQEYTYQAFEKAQLNQKHQAEKNKFRKTTEKSGFFAS